MNTRILNFLKQPTLIEEKQKASHRFVEDMPPYAINQELSQKEHGRVLSNYFFRNKDIYISRHNRYADYPTHTHTFLEMNYMLQGSATEIVDGKQITLNTGDLLLLDNGSTHSIKALGEDDLLINILFRTKNISISLLNDLRRSNNIFYDFLLSQVINKQNKNRDYLIFTKRRNQEVQATLDRIIEEYYSNNDFSNSIIKSYLSILLVQLVREYPVSGPHQENKTKLLTIKILKVIAQEYKTISLNELAQRYSYNKNYLSNVFKSEVGQTFSEVLTRQRLIQAHTLITSTSLPIATIMDQVGIKNKTFFYRKYKQYYQKLPSADR
ncbi:MULTISPECIES: AraC family transcriptional regulator [Lactiplantibacillus]|uniref:AraC family transcriptional regulator n=1 Tax=Lactiplantibacillus pentosus TaxID=1589 RepID=A0ABX5D388_LACPE|nr:MULTISPECIES: helix-turn-helix domain-containing protein [Lactiplantibacillus]MCA1343690.1 helix-turn-helix domain-containing protein [Lactiplantibacillus pentosus]MCC3162779.1 helix-turn-helix domain-containing protein [Lactiplantibacillus pentosus]MCJ8185645.1 helix-turn-helix domain-containing protein [Lactiplantibacillus pentosus]MCJ8187953.1 helix-turn-helix domain-containing protein [Lactiplantibacillus pentosus]MCM8609336.1 helix-turn-helix domain-containing protein [Lactiplantibacil